MLKLSLTLTPGCESENCQLDYVNTMVEIFQPQFEATSVLSADTSNSNVLLFHIQTLFLCFYSL